MRKSLREAGPSPCRRLVPAEHAHRRARDGRAVFFHRHVLWTAILALLCAGHGAPVLAQDASREEQEISREKMRGLDQQVQEIKSDVLGIAEELSRLEEKLLYPSNTEVAVFVSLAEGEAFRLDSAHVFLDGEPVAHHIYSFKELEALKKGGVQRIYTGNIATGEHRLEVSVAGKRPGGEEVRTTEQLAFRKGVEPKLLGITLSGGGSGGARIQLGDW